MHPDPCVSSALVLRFCQEEFPEKQHMTGFVRKTRRSIGWFITATSGVALVGAWMAACSSGGSSAPATSSTASATVMISDPATCSGPTGPFAHVYVTITDVQANISSSAGDNDNGWKDLTPTLSSQPKQVDLLGQANNQCFLATLGDTQELQAGQYQQIRLILADNSKAPSNNACDSSANCVVLSADNSVHTLLLSSESKTGLKIPSGQIASGAFNIAAGQTKDLDIDFNTCASIVQEGNGQYRLKPVLHAGEVSTTSSSINGKILDSATGNPVNGAVLVALEQKDSTGVDRIMMSTMAGSDGMFVFCPIPTGTYDIVVVGERSDGAGYAPSIVTGASNGQTIGTVNLHPPVSGTNGVANFAGSLSSQNSATQGTSVDAQVSVLESIPGGTTFTIPLLPNAQQPSATLALETASSPACSAGTDCASYSVALASGAPFTGVYTTSGVTLSQATPLASYLVDGLTFVPSSGGTTDCSPSELQTQSYPANSSGTVAIQTLAFTQCQ
jgi:hypothetical protein